MPSFAEGTSVPVTKTITELQVLVEKHGATAWGYGKEGRYERVMFVLGDRPVRFEVVMPLSSDKPYRVRASGANWAAAEHRRRWRCIYLLVKALCVAAEDGITSLREAFLPYQVLPNGQTVAVWADQQQDTVWEERRMPSLLPGERRALEA